MVQRTLLALGTLLITGSALAETYTVADGSTANYRVREQLARLSFPNDAIGATEAVMGSIELGGDGSLGESSRITVDVSSLQSDESRCDGYVRDRTLETETYPPVTFVPTEFVGLPFPLPEGGEASFEMLGDLTIKDVTRPVSWQVTATFADAVRVRGSTSFTFNAFELEKQQVMSILSVEDTLTLEVHLNLTRSEVAREHVKG